MTENILTQSRLKELFDYDDVTGFFTRKIATGLKWKAGSIAGGISSIGYVKIKVDGKFYPAHRLAWLYVYGKFPDSEIDHKNRIKTDNRISNLRMATRDLNMQNIINPGKNNTSGQRGVSWNKSKSKYIARISCNGKRYSLGDFNNFDDAVKAYVTAKHAMHCGSYIDIID